MAELQPRFVAVFSIILFSIILFSIILYYGTAVRTADVDLYDESFAQERKTGNHDGKELSVSLPADPVFITLSSKNTVNAHGHPQVEAEIESKDDVLHRIDQRLNEILALDQQRLKYLESLENRYARLEVLTQERAGDIRSELLDISRRVNNLDSRTYRIETVLDTVKANTVFLKGDLEQTSPTGESNTSNSCDNNSTAQSVKETQDKLQTLQVSVQDVRLSLDSVLDELSTIQRDITNVGDITRESLGRNKQFPTTEYLDTKIMELKNTTISVMLDMTKKFSKYEKTPPADCWDVLQNGHNNSGVYEIRPTWNTSIDVSSFNVYCDMETHGGGWTVFQRRKDGSLDFAKKWQKYKSGFGDLHGEFWLGLEHVHQLTSNKLYEILIELKDHDSGESFALYDAFVIGSETEGYRMKELGKHSGTVGDSLTYNSGQKFTTIDADNDMDPTDNCAAVWGGGGWWHKHCFKSNLNGRYLGRTVSYADRYKGVCWEAWHGGQYSMMESRMSIRPRLRS